MTEPLITHEDGTPLSEEEATDLIANATLAAGMHPAFVHAIKTTGFLLTSMNVDQFTDDDIDEWNAAIAEGESIHGPIPPSPDSATGSS